MTGSSIFFFWPGDVICYKSANGLRRNGWELWADLSNSPFANGQTVGIPPEEACVVLSKALPGDLDDHRVVLLLVSGRIVKYVKNKNYKDAIWFRFP